MNLTEFKIRQLQRRVMDQKKPVVLEVKKITSDTRAGGTNYTGEQFVLLDIYPKTKGTVKVTYGGLTKTITDTSGAEEPNAQKVFFGTFNGVSDSVETPASGTLTIEGDYAGFGSGSFSYYNSTSKAESTKYYSGITSVVDFGSINYVPDYAFYNYTSLDFSELPDSITSIGAYSFYYNGNLKLSKLPDSITKIGEFAFASCSNISLTELPKSLKSIGNNAFNLCSNISLTEIPRGVTSIGDRAFHYCEKISLTEIPEGVETIGNSSFEMGYDANEGDPKTSMYTMTFPSTLKSIGERAFAYASQGGGYYTYLSSIEILATTPPVLGTEALNGLISITVPVGCGEIYRAAEGWSDFADYITEASE